MSVRTGKAALVGLLGAAGLVLGGCSATPAAPAGVGYGADAPAVTIEFWYMPYGGADQDAAVQREAAEFHAAHPNITVKPVRVDWNDALTRLGTASTSGAGPDVTQLGTTWVGGFAALDALRPYSADELAALGGRTAFTPASWTSTSLLGRSEITAVPWLVDVRALYYRTDVLERVGLDPAAAFATWESFEATLAKIHGAGGVSPLAVGANNNFGGIHDLAPYIWGAGGDILSADASGR